MEVKIQKHIKRISESVMKMALSAIDWGIMVLSKIEFKLTRENNPNSHGYEDLTPTSRGDEDKKYSDILEWALRNNNIKNIALTGSYGSGKSSIIKTFTKEHREYNILNITLASFSDKDIDDNINRLIELSILQQMFYHVKHKQIPDSRFKRIRNLRTRKVMFKSFLVIIWLFALIVFLKPNFIIEFTLWKDYSLANNKIVSIISFLIFSIGIAYVLMKIFRILNNSKLNKLNVQSGEIEISQDVDSSILNKHLDEILYFFEVTKFDIVIIEDLDRFNNTEIFTKLRELNILVNHSKQINKRIVFLYAIKDDMFQDKNRTKFFDFIIPVIPIINTSNSGEMLLNKFKETNLVADDNNSKGLLSEDFISDVSMYIDDMRLLKNIYNEYVLYKEKLDSKLNQNNLLAMIIYKNIFPSDFVDLHNDKGRVFTVFNKKKKLIQDIINEIDKKIIGKRKEIQQLESISIKNIEELRAIYIEAIIEKIPNSISIVIDNTECQFGQLKSDDNFNSLRKVTTIQYKYLQQYGYYGQNQYRLSTGDSNLTFITIEDFVDSEQTYEERENEIIERDSNKVELLKQEIEKLQKEKQEIKSSSLFQIAEKIEISSVFTKIEQEKLIVYLIRNGYINENYHDYISFFYEGLITKDDRDFLFSIKNRNALDFKFKLTKIDNLLKKIKLKEFENKEVLNCSLLDYFLENKQRYREQYTILLSQICNKSNSSMLFIDTFLSDGINVDLFVQEICKNWRTFWYDITTTDYSDDKKNIFLTAIFTYLDINEIKDQNVNSSLSNYVSRKNDFLSFVSNMDIEKVSLMLKELNVKFLNLSVPDEENKIFNFIYDNDLYKINPYMVKVFAVSEGQIENIEFLETKNYTEIAKSGAKNLIEYINENIQAYISNVFLQIPDNIKESEGTIIFLLNNNGIKIEDKKKIVDKSENKIQILSDIESVDLIEYLITVSKVSATWENVSYYYSLSEDSINDILSEFINKFENYTELSKSKIKESLEENNPLLLKLSKSLIINESITDDCFASILLCTPYAYSPLDFAVLSDQKINLLIKNGYLKLSLERYNYTKENCDNNKHIDLLIRYHDVFLESEDNYSFDESDLLALLAKPTFSSLQKTSIIQKADKEIIKSSAPLCNQVCEILANYHYVELDYDLLKSILSNSNLIENRIKLFNIHLHVLLESSITDILNILGEPYSDISIRGKKPSIPLNQNTQTLIQKLLDKKYISSSKEKEEKIKIYTFNS